MFKSPIASPYDILESLNWLRKCAAGLSREYAGLVENSPQAFELNENIIPRYTLALVGDIMPVNGRSVGVSESLRKFIKDADYLVGNLEGIITDMDKDSPLPSSDLRHDEEIMEILGNIFPPAKTYLSVANNHAGDYGKEEFLKSARLLQLNHFNVFGWKDRPFCDINDAIRIISGTMWSNRKNDHVSWLKDAQRYLKPGAFNILYPHFGYEFELYPRPNIIDMARKSLENFDAVIGHHPHCPQPVSTEVVQGTNRLLAYSLGGLLDVGKRKLYQYGVVVKLKLGRTPDGDWAAGEVQWRLTKCSPLTNGDFMVDISEDDLLG